MSGTRGAILRPESSARMGRTKLCQWCQSVDNPYSVLPRTNAATRHIFLSNYFSRFVAYTRGRWIGRSAMCPGRRMALSAIATAMCSIPALRRVTGLGSVSEDLVACVMR